MSETKRDESKLRTILNTINLSMPMSFEEFWDKETEERHRKLETGEVQSIKEFLDNY